MAMSDERVDAAIEDVVRELTTGEPSRTFTACVLARIDAAGDSDPTRGTWRPARVMLPALAVAAAIVLAVALFRGGSARPVQEPQPTAAIENKATVETASTETGRPPVAVRSPTPRVKGKAGSSSGFDRTLGADERYGMDMDALAPAPLDIASITLTELEPLTSIRVEQLHPIEPIAVTPLGDEHEGDRP
jgi:hypothetical protein